MIHFRRATRSAAVKDALIASPAAKSSTARQAIDELGELAVMGNFTSALKNLTLMASLTLYVALAGTEPMLIGFGPDGQLHGLLARL